MDGMPRITADKISSMEKFVADGNEVVHFKLVRTEEDVRDPHGEFHPSMCHQIFNEQETIFGYSDLKISICFTAGSLKNYLGIDYKEKISPKDCDGVEPDNIVEKLDNVLGKEYETNLDVFTAQIALEVTKFQPLGELVHSFKRNVRHEKQLPVPKAPIGEKDESEIFSVKQNKSHSNGNGLNGTSNGVDYNDAIEKTFVIYKCDVSKPQFVKYLHRMEAFILWFVDAASFVDSDDEKWKFFVMYEKYKTSEGNTAYAFVGYSSVYNFYAYPANIRPRVGQMLILPPFQRQGLGVELLSAIYAHYRNDANVTEITVEDPSDDFEALRDFVDARDCMSLPAYLESNLKKGYVPQMAEEAAKKLKLTKRQARRMYELLRLRTVSASNPAELKAFRLEVKQRLNIPYKKQENDLKRMMSRKSTTELQQAAQVDDATRKTELESSFQNVYQHYRSILQRLEKYAS